MIRVKIGDAINRVSPILHKTVALRAGKCLPWGSSLPTGQPTLSEMVKSEHRVTIKRYANRRFYDAGTASYVTATDIAAMVDDEKNVVVYDAATGEDITDFILAKNRFH